MMPYQVRFRRCICMQKMKKALLVGTLIMIAALSVPAQSMASTTGHKRVGCSYKNAAHPSKNISGTCNVDYGVVGVAGPAFRRVHWSDGVITQIEISIGKASVKIDGKPAASVESSVACKLEAYRINGNVIELRGDLCR